MSLQNFTIIFDNPNSTYYAGQPVTGRVTVVLTKEKKLRGICLSLKGEAQVRWTESRQVTRNGKSHTEHDTYHAYELYADYNIWLVGSPNGDMILPPGEYVYPFFYTLPVNVPSSFEGTRGYVRYTVKCKIDRPWRFDHECKVAFTVLTPLDLNTEQNMQEPVQMTKEKYLCCCCCRSGPITIVVNVLRGFVPGQRIEAIVECDNITNEEVQVKCSLDKKVTFTAHHFGRTHVKYDETVVAVERLGLVGRNDSKTWTTNLVVPSVPASYLRYCNCIDISYFFTVKGVVGGAHSNMHISVPVVIGTIPLRAYFPAIIPSAPVYPVAPCGDFPPAFNDAVGMPTAPPLQPVTPYPDMPPPTYEECMLGKGNIRNEEDSEHVLGAMDFAPRYPMYNFR